MQRHTPPRLVLALLAVLSVVCHSPGALAQPSIPLDEKPLQVEGRLPESVVVATSGQTIPEDLLAVPMLRDLTGLIAILKPRDFVSLNRLSRPVPDRTAETDSDPIAYIQYTRGQVDGQLAVRVVDDETLSLTRTGDTQSVWEIRREVFDRLGISLGSPTIFEAFEPSSEAISMVLPTPHTQSELVLDPQTVRSRIRISFPHLTRDLGKETFRVRLPRNYDPQSPAGVLVWISPSIDGRIPSIFEPVCDELGLIAIGVDNNGNDRAITDRLQNHLDSIETLARHARIDRSRVYLTGMSGGGRCCGILQLAFPDRFAGAVPIVGLDTYHNAPTGTAGQYWPKRLGKPNGGNMRLLKDRRIRSITGSADFNEPEMTLRTQLLRDDGVNAEIDVIEGMAHTMPSAQQFNAALTWVDEPRREIIAQAQARCTSILEETQGKDVSQPAVRRQLIEVMTLIPYSEQAWQAAARLGYNKPD